MSWGGEKPRYQRVTDIAPTVLEMVNQADGFTDEADYRNITLTRKKKTYRIDLLALYENGNVEQNVLFGTGRGHQCTGPPAE